MSKKQDIIQSWLKFSEVEGRNIQQFISYASYYYELPKSYIRSIIAEYNTQAEIEKREKEEQDKKKYENMLKEIMKDL